MTTEKKPRYNDVRIVRLQFQGKDTFYIQVYKRFLFFSYWQKLSVTDHYSVAVDIAENFIEENSEKKVIWTSWSEEFVKGPAYRPQLYGDFRLLKKGSIYIIEMFDQAFLRHKWKIVSTLTAEESAAIVTAKLRHDTFWNNVAKNTKTKKIVWVNGKVPFE